MNIVTSITANIGSALADRLAIFTTSQNIQADGEMIDARSMWSAKEVDRLVARCKTHPYTLGTSSTEMVTLFRDRAKEQKEFIVVTTSRKLSGTFDATNAAQRAYKALQIGDINVAVVDSSTTDIGQGLVTLYAAASAKLGKQHREVAEATAKFAAAGCSVFVPQTFDYLVKGGRASFLKAMVATLIGKLPLISFTDGELKSDGTTSKGAGVPQALVDHVGKKIARGRKVWVGVAHGANPDGAQAVVRAAKAMFDVKEVMVRELSPAVYMHMGAGAICLSVYPIDVSPWPLDPALA